MLIDCQGNLIELNNFLKKVKEGNESFFVYKKNEKGEKYLFETDKEGNIINNKFAHIKIDESIKLVNDEFIKWYKIESLHE